MCVGGQSGKYFEIATRTFAPAISDVSELVPVTTGGSMAELGKIASGECDAALVVLHSCCCRILASPSVCLTDLGGFDPRQQCHFNMEKET